MTHLNTKASVSQLRNATKARLKIPDNIHYPVSIEEKSDFCVAIKKSQLTLEQRYQIQAYKEAGKTQTEIAGLIGKDRSGRI